MPRVCPVRWFASKCERTLRLCWKVMHCKAREQEENAVSVYARVRRCITHDILRGATLRWEAGRAMMYLEHAARAGRRPTLVPASTTPPLTRGACRVAAASCPTVA
jgi:hypothetical protein